MWHSLLDDATAPVGGLSNADVFLGAATVISLAIFLPASKEGGAIYFGTSVGKQAFFITLGGLLLAVITTFFSTIISFWTFVGALLVGVVLGAIAVRAAKKEEERLEQAERVLRRGRPSITAGAADPPPDDHRCQATTGRGVRCLNSSRTGGYCKTHTTVLAAVN